MPSGTETYRPAPSANLFAVPGVPDLSVDAVEDVVAKALFNRLQEAGTEHGHPSTAPAPEQFLRSGKTNSP